MVRLKLNSLHKKRGKMRLDRLIAIRHARNMTQQELADKTGISIAQIQRYEKGKSDPTMTAAIALAKALECSLDWLAGLSDDTQGRVAEKDLTASQRRLLAAYRGSKDSFEKLRDVLAALASDEELMTKRDE